MRTGGTDVPQCRFDFRTSYAREALADRPVDCQHGQASLNVSAKRLNMDRDNSVDGGPARRIEVAQREKMLGQRPALISRPGGECGE